MDVLVTSLILTNAKTVEKTSFDNLGFLIYLKEEAKNIPMEFFFILIMMYTTVAFLPRLRFVLAPQATQKKVGQLP